jgi:hypothetical protein
MTADVKSPPSLRPARFDDYAQIAQLESAHGLEALPLDDWCRLWLDNPLWPRLGGHWPIGWVLEGPEHRIVGSLANVPSLYRFRGRELICANGRGWVAAAEYRAFALWLMDEYFNQPGAELFINTTVNPLAVQALSTLSTPVPIGDWKTVTYWVTGYRGFARRVLQMLGAPLAGPLAIPAASALWVKDVLFARSLPAATAPVEIEAVSSFDVRFDRFWEELVRQGPETLLAVRDRQALSWHFAIPTRRGQLWVFTASRNGMLRAYCVLKQQNPQQGLRRMRLVDYQTLERDTDLLPDLLHAALRRCAAAGHYVLEHLGAGLPKMRTFDQCAPHRRKLANWPFYYHAADPALAAELQRPDVWAPSAFDGDASIE